MFRRSLKTVSRFYHQGMEPAMLAARNRIVWMDLEVLASKLIQTINILHISCRLLKMTGLDDTKDHILEAACLVTDGDLNIVAEGPNIIINQPDSILDSMGEWCKKTHGEVVQLIMIHLI